MVAVVLALIVVAGLTFMLRDLIVESPVAQIGFGLVLGGAMGNIIDRVLHHYVIDFIAPRWFYIFNGADSCITAGLILLALRHCNVPRRTERAGSNPTARALVPIARLSGVFGLRGELKCDPTDAGESALARRDRVRPGVGPRCAARARRRVTQA